jgi:hypothetical protein
MSTPAPPVTALQDVASAKAWLARQPQANATQLQAALATEIARLNQGAATPAARLSILEFLREAVSFAQGECVKKFSGRALPLAPHEQFAYEASRTLWQLLGDGYRLCLDAAEAGDPEMRSQAALAAQRAIATASMLQFDAYRAQHEVGSVFWQNLHRLYAAAERLGCAETEVDDGLRLIGKSVTPGACYALVLLFYTISPYQLNQRQLIVLRRWIARWCPKVAILRTPPADDNLAALPVDIAGAGPAGPSGNAGGSLRWLDTTAMRGSIRVRLVKLKEGVAPVELTLGDDLSAEVAEELLLHLYRHSSRSALPRVHPRRDAHGEIRVASGLGGIHFHVSGKLFREPGSTSTMTRQHANEMATLGRVSTAEEEERAMRDFAPETWRLLDQSAGGLRIAREAGPPQRRLGAGQLIALKGQGDESFLLAITRWLVAVGNGEVNAGVMWIPGAPLGVTARTTELAGRETFERAFVMPEIARLKVPATLILPLNSFRGPREVELVNPTLGRLKLTALMMRGMDFDRVLFEPLA